ncbi:MAG: ADOP family duplicated permease [Gemmatimonadaceae bacterium]
MAARSRPPSIPLLLLSRLVPRAEREEVLADVQSEYATRLETDGRRSANQWLWQQALGSAPSLMRWSWWRGINGFEPPANNYRSGGPMLKNVFADVRYATRRLIARPAYSLLAIITLALGIGGTAAVYGIARPLMFDPLPYANEKDLVTFWYSGAWTEQEFTYLRHKFPGFQSVAAHRGDDVTLRDGNAPARLLNSLSTSAELFDVLGAHPMMGDGFKPGDDVIGAEPKVVLSYGLWQELGANKSIIGSRLTLQGISRTVTGVMPRGFWYPDPSTRVWIPQAINPEGQNGSFTLVGHVAAGQDAHNMQPQVAALVKILSERFTYGQDWNKTKDPKVIPIREDLLGSMRPALLATFAAMGLILLIACTNVAALMLGQLEGRAPELAVRSALGANRRRLAQPLFVEAMLIGLSAGVAGALAAAAGFGTLARALPLGAFSENAAFDWQLFVAAMVVAVFAVLLVVTIPSIALFRRQHADLQRVLTQSRLGGVRGGARVERGLVIAEVALAMLIASGAALLVRSVNNLYAINPGFDPNGVAVAMVFSGSDVSREQRSNAFDELLRAFGQMPNVQSVSYAMRVPLRGNSYSNSITIDGKPDLPRTSTFYRPVSLGYFTTMGIPLKSGRLFDGTDQPNVAELSVVVNEALARKYFPNEDPIGKRIGGGSRLPQRIIGVVGDVTEGALKDPAKPVRYFLATQMWVSSGAAFVVKTQHPEQAEALLDAMRNIIKTRTPILAIDRMTTMQRMFDTAVGPARQIMTLLSLLSALALVLGAVGIYGVLAHFATRRKRDWAIRVALGLPGSRVITNILRQGAALIVAGVVLGGALTITLSHFLSSMLYGVSGVDALAFAGASLAVLVTGLLAAFIPAHRAGTVDPALVLREQ